MLSGIEIAKKRHPPYLQAKFPLIDYDHHKVLKIGDNSTASFKQIIKANERFLEYKINYNESYAFQIKTWMKLEFIENIEIVYEDGKVEKVNCRHDKSKVDFEGLTFGINWDRVKVMPTNVNSPIKFTLGDLTLFLLNPKKITHVILYRRKDFSAIEITFIWKRFKIPKDLYELGLKLIRNN